MSYTISGLKPELQLSALGFLNVPENPIRLSPPTRSMKLTDVKDNFFNLNEYLSGLVAKFRHATVVMMLEKTSHVVPFRDAKKVILDDYATAVTGDAPDRIRTVLVIQNGEPMLSLLQKQIRLKDARLLMMPVFDPRSYGFPLYRIASIERVTSFSSKHTVNQVRTQDVRPPTMGSRGGGCAPKRKKRASTARRVATRL